MAAAHLRVILLGGGHIASSSDASDRFRPGPAGPAGRRQPAPTLARDLGAQERDPRRLEQRRKQVGLGKRTEGYLRYAAAVPRRARDPRLANEAPAGELPHPRTPSATQQCSKRSWDGQVRKWRRLLHAWDSVPARAAAPGGGGDGGSGEARAPSGKRAREGGEPEEEGPQRKQPRGREGGRRGESEGRVGGTPESPAGSDSLSGLEGLGAGGEVDQKQTIALFTGGLGDMDDGLGGG